MDILDCAVNYIYSNKILSDLIKNDVIIYGQFIRKLIYEYNYINDKIWIIYGFSRNIYRDIIERDLDKYLVSINEKNNISTTRCCTVKYNIIFEEKLYNITISYIKSNISWYLNYYKSELNLNFDIDCIYIDRNSLGAINVNNLYSTAPSPFFKIIDHIKKKKFKILNQGLIFNKNILQDIDILKNQGYTNVENKLIKINYLKDKDIFTEICPICKESHDINTIKLPCNHYFHEKCIYDYLKNYIKELNESDIEKKFKCPYCTIELNILEII